MLYLRKGDLRALEKAEEFRVSTARRSRSRQRDREVSRGASALPPATRRRAVAGCGAAALSGILLATALLFPQLCWAAWPALALLIAAISGCEPKTAAVGGACAGVAFYGLAGYWIVDTIATFSGFHWVVAVLLFAAFCLASAGQFALFGWLCARFRDGAPLLVYPLMWVATEWLYPQLFPWKLAYSQSPWLSLIQVSEWTGACGISFVMVWTAALFCHSLRPGARQRRWIADAGCWAGSAAVILGFGYWRIANLAGRAPDGPPVNVALIQPGKLPLLQNCLNLTRALTAAVDVVCWPESALPGLYPVDHDRLTKPALGTRYPPPPFSVGLDDTFLLAGAGTQQPPAKDGNCHVSALLIDPQDHIVGRYHKQSLLPFGEYVPGEQWIPALHRLLPAAPRYVPGTDAAPLQVGSLFRAGLLICYEDLMPHLARRTVRQGADVLINLTNDLWFGHSPALTLHKRFAVFRAVECKRTLLRCTTTGATTIIGPTGAVLADAPLNQPATLIATITPLAVTTFYTRWGDVFAWMCAAGCLVVAGRGRFRAQGAPGQPDLARGPTPTAR